MRIMFDAYWLQNGPPSGSAVVTGMLSGWMERFPKDEIFAMVSERALPWARETFPSVKFVGVKSRNHSLAVQFVLGRLAASVNAEVVVAQNFTPSGRVPAFVFIHDVLFRSNPEWFTFAERLYLSQITWGLRRRPTVLTSSRTEAARIESFYPLVGAVVPVGLAGSPALFSASSVRPRDVPPEFLLSVGRLNVRKNLGTVVKAYIEAQKAGVALAPLVVVGPAAGLNFQSLGETGKDITWLGAVSDAELRWLYEHANGLIFASLDEGFGLPPVEALAFGCPVLVSDIPVMHEVVGADASYFDPRNVSELKQALRQFSEHPRGHRAKPASWSDVTVSIREAIRDQA